MASLSLLLCIFSPILDELNIIVYKCFLRQPLPIVVKRDDVLVKEAETYKAKNVSNP